MSSQTKTISQCLIKASMATVALVLAFQCCVEARGFDASLEQPQLAPGYADLSYTPPMAANMGPFVDANPMNQADSDDEDDEDERVEPLQAARIDSIDSIRPMPSSDSIGVAGSHHQDLKTAASHHHKGHGAKGWLDMGAWSGKKGAFGWYDKHPVGKGK